MQRHHLPSMLGAPTQHLTQISAPSTWRMERYLSALILSIMMLSIMMLRMPPCSIPALKLCMPGQPQKLVLIHDAAARLSQVLLRGRVHSVRGKGKSCFLILRQQTHTIQVIHPGPRRTDLLCCCCCQLGWHPCALPQSAPDQQGLPMPGVQTVTDGARRGRRRSCS